MAHSRNFLLARSLSPSDRLPIDFDAEELNELFAACLPRLQMSARKMFRTPQDSEDGVQEALLLAFRKLHQFEGRSSFSTWLHSIVRNIARLHYRKAKAHPTISDGEEVPDGDGSSIDTLFVDQQPNPEDACIQRERSWLFREASGELPEKYQPAIDLFYRGGLGEEATARTLGMSVPALKAQLHRSRLLLTSRIQRKCRRATRAPRVVPEIFPRSGSVVGMRRRANHLPLACVVSSRLCTGQAERLRAS